MKRKFKQVFSSLLAVLMLVGFSPLINWDICGAFDPPVTILTTQKDVNPGEEGYSEEGYVQVQSDGGTGSLEGKYILTAVPRAGYKFSYWNMSSLTTYTRYEHTENLETSPLHIHVWSTRPESSTIGIDGVIATAVFEKESYNVELSVSPDTNAGSASVNPTTAPYQSEVNLSAIAAPGYTFSNWEVTEGTGTTIENPTSQNTTLTMGTTNVKVRANFTGIPHNVTVTDDGHGSATADPTENVIVNTPVSLKATANSGYTFNYWEITGGIPWGDTFDQNAAETSFSMGITNVGFKAHFTANPYTVTVTNDDGHGSGSATPHENVHVGDTVRLSATPISGYEFDRWEVVSGETGQIDLTNPNATFTMPAGNVEIKSHFKAIPSVTYSVTTTNDGHGSASANPSSNISAGTNVQLNATPSSGYEFDRWEVLSGNVGQMDLTKYNATFTMPAENVSLKANFKAIPVTTYSVTVSDDGHGSASANPSSNVAAGASVQLSATPTSGYEFDRWEVLSGNVGQMDLTKSNATFTMPASDVSLKANFKTIPAATYTVTTSVEGEGTAEATPSSGVATGETVQLKATATEGYQFKGWDVVSGEVNISDPSSSETTFTMGTQNVVVKATFEKISVIGITLNSENAKKSYTKGDALSLNGLTIDVLKSDGSTQTINVTRDMITGFDSSQVGTQELTVTYAGYTDTYEVEVKDKSVTPDEGGTTPSKDSSSSQTPTYDTTGSGSSSAYETGSKDISTPKTDDTTNIIPWILMMTVSLAGLVFSSSRWKKKKFCNR